MNTFKPRDPMTSDKEMGNRKKYGVFGVARLVNATAGTYTHAGWMEIPNSKPLGPLSLPPHREPRDPGLPWPQSSPMWRMAAAMCFCFHRAWRALAAQICLPYPWKWRSCTHPFNKHFVYRFLSTPMGRKMTQHGPCLKGAYARTVKTWAELTDSSWWEQ